MSQCVGILTDNNLTSHEKFSLCQHSVSTGLGPAPILPSMLQQDAPNHQIHGGRLLQLGKRKEE